MPATSAFALDFYRIVFGRAAQVRVCAWLSIGMLHLVATTLLASVPQPTQLLPQVRDPTAIQRAFIPKALEVCDAGTAQNPPSATLRF